MRQGSTPPSPGEGLACSRGAVLGAVKFQVTETETVPKVKLKATQ